MNHLHRHSTASRVIVICLIMMAAAFFFPNASISAPGQTDPVSADPASASSSDSRTNPDPSDRSGKRLVPGLNPLLMYELAPAVQKVIQRPKGGFIAAKGRVLGPNNKPIWAKFDEKGRVVKEIGEAFEEPLKSARMMSGDLWRHHEQAWIDVVNEYGEELELLTREEYEEREFKRPDETVIKKPKLEDLDTVSVVVRKEEFVYTESIPLLLLASPLDLEFPSEIYEEDQAVLLSKDGVVIDAAEVNIGFRTAFYTPMGSTRQTPYPDNPDFPMGHWMKGYNYFRDQLWGPIKGAEVRVLGLPKDLSDDKGAFRAPVPYGYWYYLVAKLRYRCFNPKRYVYGGYLRVH